MKKIRWPGSGWKYSCQRCGVWFPSTEIKAEWTGLRVCPRCWEPRHPQTLIKITGEKAFPSFVNKDVDVFVGVCSIATNTAYADVAGADCAQADRATPAYSVVKDLFTNGHGGM